MATAGFKIKWLQDAAQNKPEYATIIPLFVELYQYLEIAGGDTGINFTVSAERLREKREHGFPLLAHDSLSVDTVVCTTFLKGALYVLSQAGREGGPELEKIGKTLENGTLPLHAVFRSILERDRTTMDAVAEATGVPAPLLEYVCEIPLKAALEQFSAGVSAEVCDGWQEGYCPVCGARAGMAELSGEEGRRFLSCSACTFRWAFKRLQCPYCGNDEVETLSYFMAGEGSTRVDTCSACSRYIKTRDSRKGNGDMPLDVEDLLTMHLDLLAAREGFERGQSLNSVFRGSTM